MKMFTAFALRKRTTADRAKLTAIIAAGVLIAALFVDRATAANPPAVTETKNQFFDWFVNISDSYLPSPFLTDASAAAVNAFLEKRPAGSIRAVKIEVPISNKTSNLIFNNPRYHVSYVLGDLEMQNANQKLKSLAEQVRFVNGQNNGVKTQSYNAFIGSYGFQKLSNDFTNPAQYNKKKGTHSWSGYNLGDYQSAKLNMSMPELYPGSGSLRNPVAGNSSAPNIRSALFTLPIMRVSQIQMNQSPSERMVPYVARFNNWGNLAFDTDRNSTNGYKFEPGKAMPARFGLPAMSASQTKDQMLSRRDFATQVAHYRLRGINSYVTFEPGVVGYLNDTKRNDARSGFTLPEIDTIFAAKDYKLLLGKDTDYPPPSSGAKDPNGNIIIDGKDKSVEAAGAIFSGVYSLTSKKLAILLSNMDNNDHLLTLPPTIGGYALRTKTFDVDSGGHLLIEYKLTTSGLAKGWSITSQKIPFLQFDTRRDGIGVPEPTSMTFLYGMGLLTFMPRYRRRKARR